MSGSQEYSEAELACLVLEDGSSTFTERKAAKIADRQELLQLEPEVAQGIVNQSLQAREWEPDIQRNVWEESLPRQSDDFFGSRVNSGKAEWIDSRKAAGSVTPTSASAVLEGNRLDIGIIVD